MALEFDPAFPVRVTSGGQNLHPSAADTTRGLLALVYETATPGEVWRSYSLDRGATWASGQKFVSRAETYQPRARYNHRGGFALVYSGVAGERDVYFEEILEVVSVSDNLVSVNIKRSTDASSKGADITVHNPRRRYDPEVPNTKWSGVFLPGTPVEVLLGYGGERVTRFFGYLDNVSLDDEEPVITCQARGQFKQLLDQSLRTKRYHTNARRTATIAGYAIEAGMDAEMVQVQDSPVRYSGEDDREKTFQSVIQENSDALGFEVLEPDEGGLICRAPSASTTPQWFYEEETNMYSREREFDDDEVYTRVQVYREDKLRDNGTVELAGFTVERVVDTPLLTPAGKIYYVQADETMTEAQAGTIADTLALRIGREGSKTQIAAPLNVALEVGDVVNIRRKSLGVAATGVYICEELDDDATQDGFVSTIQARRVG